MNTDVYISDAFATAVILTFPNVIATKSYRRCFCDTDELLLAHASGVYDVSMLIFIV